MGTGKVLECEKEAFIVLEALEKGKTIDKLEQELSAAILEKGLEQIRIGVQEENILQAPELKSFAGGQTGEFEEYVNNHF